jgi:hypothetical protein
MNIRHFFLIFLVMLASGCAKRLEVLYQSSPTGATITYDVSGGGKNTVWTPARIPYDGVYDKGNCNYIWAPSATWPDGASIPAQMTTICAREFTFYKPVRTTTPPPKPPVVTKPPVQSVSEENYFKGLDNSRLCRVIDTGSNADVNAARRELNARGEKCLPINPVSETIKVPPPPIPKTIPKPVVENPLEIRRQKCLRLGLVPGSIDYQQCLQ